jgi:solute carrier family 45 protein 1/2/4
MAYIMPNPFF